MCDIYIRNILADYKDDASGFINLFGLPLKVRAMKLQNVEKNQK